MNWIRRTRDWAATGEMSGVRVEPVEAFRIVDERGGRRVSALYETAASARDAAEQMGRGA